MLQNGTLITQPPCIASRHTSRFLLVWLIMLPFTLWAAYSWTSVFLSGIFGFLMLGIDEIGVQIEEPFGWVFYRAAMLEQCGLPTTLNREQLAFGVCLTKLERSSSPCDA
jgi:hypothetical protein